MTRYGTDAAEIDPPWRSTKGNQHMMTALTRRYRRFEVRFRDLLDDSAYVPGLPDPHRRERITRHEPEDTSREDHAVDHEHRPHRFVRQPVKILLVPRHCPDQGNS